MTKMSNQTSETNRPILLGRETSRKQRIASPLKSWLQGQYGQCLLAAFSLAWLAIGETDEVVVATGMLEPLGSVKDIKVPVGGVVKDILVTEGQQVVANQILLQLDAEADLERRQSLQENIKLKQNQLDLNKSGFNILNTTALNKKFFENLTTRTS